jgi:hypothetical protein
MIPNLLTPEQVAERMPLVSAWWVREQCRRGRVEHLRLSKGRIAFTESQVEALIAYATTPVRAAKPSGIDSLTTPRARARRRTA